MQKSGKKKETEQKKKPRKKKETDKKKEPGKKKETKKPKAVKKQAIDVDSVMGELLQDDVYEKTMVDKILEMWARFPGWSASKIGRELNINYKTVLHHLSSKQGLKVQDNVTRRTQNQLLKLREPSIKKIEDILNGNYSDEKKARIELDAAKFVLGPAMISMEEQPEEIIFETIIAKTGSLQKNVHKIFKDQKKLTAPT